MMSKLRFYLVCFASFCTPMCALAVDDGRDFFEQRIRPVLFEHCYECHSAEAANANKLRGGLRLDTKEGARAGGDTGPALVPGAVDKSLLIHALRHEDGLEMPPSGRLPDRVIADFARWIEMGAPDPRGRESGIEAAAANTAEPARNEHWAFQPPRVARLPEVRLQSWPETPWDFFVLARLEQSRLRPLGKASKWELIRRLTFDLIGLPPTMEQVEAFLEDASPRAYLHVVDRLLESPHYGERWGRVWLDVARYADDKALAYHNPWPHAYRYRDWVIDALNADMAYNRFVRLQLAGDLVPDPVSDYTTRLAGLGFQGLGAFYHKGSVPKQVMADELDDRIDTLSRGLLGLTVACARCHDHKYDPISTKDYYSLAAAYNGADWVELKMAAPEVIAAHDSWAKRKKELEDIRQQWLAAQRSTIVRDELARVRRYLTAAWRIHHGIDGRSSAGSPLKSSFLDKWVQLLRSPNRAAQPSLLAEWVELARRQPKSVTPSQSAVSLPKPLRLAGQRLEAELQAALVRHDRIAKEPVDAGEEQRPASDEELKVTARQQELLNAVWLDETAPFFVKAEDVEHLLNHQQREHLTSLQSELDQHVQSEPFDPPLCHGVAGGGEAMHVLVRGDVTRAGEPAPPRFLRLFAQEGRGVASDRFTRLDLATEICTAENPLTARVIVNRIWQHHFGQGVVATASNFGLLGDRPTHPELLDTLTVRFIESGWSLKWLHRQIVTMAAYQLSSRDGTTGDTHRGEGRIIDPENRLLWRFSPRRLPVESWRDAVLAVSGQLESKLAGKPAGRAEDGHPRRTIYSTISRREPDKLLATFDFPDANVTTERRQSTTVPQQQLFMLNSAFMLASANHLATRALQNHGDNVQAVRAMYQLAFARDPWPDELQAAEEFLALAGTGDREMDGWQQLAQAILASNEFSWID